jgi:hypothetical protein
MGYFLIREKSAGISGYLSDSAVTDASASTGLEHILMSREMVDFRSFLSTILSRNPCSKTNSDV